MADDFLSKEYFALVDIVKDFDQRLLTVKGWGVTLSLAALGLGFQYSHYGLFLVAAISAIGFWSIEAVTKIFQMRHYVRMREIEVRRAELALTDIPTPQIDWSWQIAAYYFKGEYTGAPPHPNRYGYSSFNIRTWFYPHVFLPHAISLVAGGILFVLGITGSLHNIMNW
jgi:hypothetical protein